MQTDYAHELRMPRSHTIYATHEHYARTSRTTMHPKYAYTSRTTYIQKSHIPITNTNFERKLRTQNIHASYCELVHTNKHTTYTTTVEHKWRNWRTQVTHTNDAHNLRAQMRHIGYAHKLRTQVMHKLRTRVTHTQCAHKIRTQMTDTSFTHKERTQVTRTNDVHKLGAQMTLCELCKKMKYVSYAHK